MKKLLLPVIALACLTVPAIAQEPPANWGIAVFADLRSKETSVVVMRRIGPLERPFGLRCTFDVEGFAGSTQSGNAVVGVSVSTHLPLARNFDFKIGLGTTWQPGQRFQDAGVGLIIGGTYRF